MNTFARVFATWFGSGYVPKGPGTAGSLVAILIAAIIGPPPWFYTAFAVLMIAPACWAAGVTARISGLKDPQIIVVDEVIGQWITLAGAIALNWKSLLLAFLLFRLFDIWKPWPVRQFEKLPGGIGIVMDDVMAGVYAALVLYIAGWFNLGSHILYGIS